MGMIVRRLMWALLALSLPISTLLAQQSPPDPQPADQPRDISTVDPAPLGGAIAVDIPEESNIDQSQFEIPELSGARQAIGSQLVDGELPRPLADYSVRLPELTQRITLFRNGLVAIRISARDGVLAKKIILPEDALTNYQKELTTASLNDVQQQFLTVPIKGSLATLRVYEGNGSWVERKFDPTVMLPASLARQRTIMEDLLRAVAQDREVSSSVAGYRPSVGDQLVSSDRKVYEVTRLMQAGAMVELRCLSEPTRIFVASKDLHNLFIGSRRTAPHKE